MAGPRAGAAERGPRPGAHDGLSAVFAEVARKHLGAARTDALFPGFTGTATVGVV